MARTQDTSFLEAALAGYQQEVVRIADAIADLQKRLGKVGTLGNTWSNPVQFKAAPTARKKHRISAEGRARIAAAQRKRWAAAKKG